VGSGAGDPGAFRAAISAARGAWNMLCAIDPEASHRPMLLDLGGGFTGGFTDDGSAFVSVGSTPRDAVALAINAALEDFFPTSDFTAGLTVISEPGRYFAEASSAIVTRVVGRRIRSSHKPIVISIPNSSDEEEEEKSPSGGIEDGELHYYISDGIYGAFNAIIYDGWLPKAIPFRVKKDGSPEMIKDTCRMPATFFGPTCDSLDMVFNRISNCPELEVGDYLLFPSGGAYTLAGATDFNGIPATANGGVRSFYVRSMDLSKSESETCFSSIFSSKPPMSVSKNFS